MPGRPLTLPLLVLLVVGCTPIGDPATPRPTVTSAPSARPSMSPEPSASAASVAPSPSATLQPTPPPDPAAPETLDLEVTGCPGGVVVDWSPATHPEFHHYTALRSIEAAVDTAYPPIAPAVDWGHSYATDRFVTSAVDATLIPSETVLYYRVMGYDAVNRVVAASGINSTHPTEVIELGTLVVEAGEGGAGTHLDWTLFGGLGRCFTAYHVLIGPVGSTPSSTLTVISDQATTELDTVGLRSGSSYTIQVIARRSTTLGSFVVARTEVATYTVP
jgi:hypothetical protein